MSLEYVSSDKALSYEAKAPVALEQLGLSVAREHLDTACQQASAENWSYSHFVGYLLEGELQERHRKTVALNLQFARFPYLKQLEDFSFAAQPGLDRRLIEELATGRFLHEGRNLVFLGPPGCPLGGWAKRIWPLRWEYSRRRWDTAFIL